MLGIFSYFVLNVADKYIRLPDAFLWRYLEFFPREKMSSIVFTPSFILLLTIEDTIFQKNCRKKYAFMCLRVGGLKVILALLTKIVVFFVRNAIIKVRVSVLDRSIWSVFLRFGWRRNQSQLIIVLHIHLHKLPQQVICRCQNKTKKKSWTCYKDEKCIKSRFGPWLSRWESMIAKIYLSRNKAARAGGASRVISGLPRVFLSPFLGDNLSDGVF